MFLTKPITQYIEFLLRLVYKQIGQVTPTCQPRRSDLSYFQTARYEEEQSIRCAIKGW